MKSGRGRKKYIYEGWEEIVARFPCRGERLNFTKFGWDVSEMAGVPYWGDLVGIAKYMMAGQEIDDFRALDS